MNQYWINFTLIVSGVIIFLAVVTPSILQVILSSSRKDLEEKNNDSRNLRSAVWAPIVFIGTFMVLIGICIFSFEFSGCSVLLDFMSLASAIVSIILAVLTIVYSYYTTGASSRNIENVQESVKDLKKTAKSMDDVSLSLDKGAKKLSDNLKLIFERLDVIEKNTRPVADYIDEGAPESSKSTANRLQDVDFELILKNCPKVPLMFLYACGKLNVNQEIRLDDLFDEDPAPVTMMYVLGFSSALKMMGLLELTVKPKDFMVQVRFVNKKLIDAVNKKVSSKSKDSFIINLKRKIDSL